MIPVDLADDGEEAEEMALALILDDLAIKVWKGRHALEPTSPPDHEYR